MRKALYLAVTALVAGIIAGCSGGGGTSITPPPPTVTRYISGFVYVKGDGSGGTGPGAVISNSSSAPTGYFAPDSGVLRVAASAGGDVSAFAQQLDIDFSTNGTGNSFILKVTGPANGSATVTFSTVTPFARSANPTVTSKTLNTYSVNLGTSVNNNTTLTVASTNDFNYTPGAPASIQTTVDGNVPDGSTTFVSGQDYALAAAVFDQNGVAISGATPTFNSVGAGATRVSIVGGTLSPAEVPTAETEGPVTIETALSGGALLTQQFTAQFSFGTATSIVMTSAGSKTNLLWEETTSVNPLDTIDLTITINNQNGVGMPGASYTFGETNVTTNTWNNANGTAFVGGNTGTADANGQATVTLNAPAKKDAVLTGADLTLKGAQTISVSSGSANQSLNIFVLRPLASIAATGPSRMDVGQTSASSGANSFHITGGVDIDNEAVAASRVVGPFTWTVTPTDNSGGTIFVGDIDDQSVRSIAVPGNNASTGDTLVITAGTVAGDMTVSVSNGTINSNNISTSIYGPASKIKFTPATSATGYAGATGFVQVFNASVLDSYGHDVTSECVFNVKTATTDSLSGANIVATALPSMQFTLTAGNADGTFTVTLGGNWTGAAGGSSTFGITRGTGIDVP